jgi:hypothetical protein
MLATYSQYSPQGLVPQFPGLLFGGLGAGVPPTSPVAFAPNGTYAGGMPFGYDSRQAGFAQYPFAPQPGLVPPGAFAPNALVAPYPYLTTSPYLPSPWQHTSYGLHPGVIAGQPATAQISWLMSQLAQQICAQAAIAQQTGIALYQLAQHLVQQGIHTHQHSVGLDAGHGFAGAQPFMTQALPQPFLSPFANPFAGPFASSPQSGYGAVSPQLGASWGTSRPPTIQ